MRSRPARDRGIEVVPAPAVDDRGGRQLARPFEVSGAHRLVQADARRRGACCGHCSHLPLHPGGQPADGARQDNVSPVLGIVVVSFGSASLLRANLAGLDRTAMRTPSTVVVVDNFRGSSAREAVRSVSDGARLGADRERDERRLRDRRQQPGSPGPRRSAARRWSSSTRTRSPTPACWTSSRSRRRPRRAPSSPPASCGRTAGPGSPAAGSTCAPAAPGTSTCPRRRRPTGGSAARASPRTPRGGSELGGFDDEYFLYWEDVDLSYRCTRAGGALLVRQDLEVLHDVGGTQEPTAGSRGEVVDVLLLQLPQPAAVRRPAPRPPRRRTMAGRPARLRLVRADARRPPAAAATVAARSRQSCAARPPARGSPSGRWSPVAPRKVSA